MIHFQEGPMDGLHNEMFGEEQVTGVWDPEHNLYRLMNEDGTEHGIMDSPAFSRKMKRPRWWRRLILFGIAFPLMMFAWALK